MINIKMQQNEDPTSSPKITVIGVGGAGGNAVNNMIASNLDGCDFLVCNTDAQALSNSAAEGVVQLGSGVTGGLGAGSKPEIGQAAAEESLEEVMRHLDGANMAFVTCGMGGGTGTGAAPVIAKACRQQGILTVGVVTKPFHFEGAHRMEQAEKGIEEMQQYVDTLIVIPNQNLFRIADEKTTFAEGFKMADTVLQSGVRGVTDLMVKPGIVNLDFADIRTSMLQMGKAMMGTGEASGEKRAVEAAESAINNPLLDDVSMKGANGVIINVTGGFDMTLFEVDEACNRIRDEVDPMANIIFGTTFDESMDGIIRVSIVATGIENEELKAKVPSGGATNSNNYNTRNTSGGGNTAYGQFAPKANISIASETASVTSSPVKVLPKEKPSVAMSGREVVQGISAPSRVYREPSETTIYKTVSATSSVDMFEQSEFTSPVAQEEILRGSTYNNSFIPPEPMEPDMSIPENGIGSHLSSFHGTKIEASKISPQIGSSLELHPPKDITASSRDMKANRMPSLLERITGTVQHHIDNLRDDGAAPSSVKSEPTNPSMPETPLQGSLNISSPSGKPAVKLDDELDIPAFLRRQAN